ncbi:hypothetical protein OAX38_02385 [Flavobacteriaceae bacterium]|jgi:hypothetical protein|nr:hypothetical protein [Flavobacteriaceae bacterium]
METLHLDDISLRIDKDFEYQFKDYTNSKFRVLSTEFYEKPNPIIEIYDQDKDYWDILATLGNISTIKGKAKSRKSTLLSLIVASAISGEVIEGKIRSNLPKNKQNILYIDTEQQLHHVSFNLHRVKTLTNSTDIDGSLYMYCLRPLSPKERNILRLSDYTSIEDDNFLFIINQSDFENAEDCNGNCE